MTVPETQPNIDNWIECINSRDRCAADIEYGQRSSKICHLVNIAREVGWVGRRLKWDPAAEHFANCDQGNKLLARARRKGYELPAWSCGMAHTLRVLFRWGKPHPTGLIRQ